MPTPPRVVRPELLDALPADDPDARASRRDLRRLNRLGGAVAWWLRHLPPLLRPGDAVLDLGAGDGTLCAALRPRLPAGTRWTALDLRAGADLPGGPDAWVEADAFAGSSPGHAAVVANLFLHHADDPALRRLGARLVADPSLRLIAAVEPHRSRAGLAWFALACAVLRLNRVTRHDGRISLHAGFRAGELAALLGLEPDCWHLREPRPGLGLIGLLALRRA